MFRSHFATNFISKLVFLLVLTFFYSFQSLVADAADVYDPNQYFVDQAQYIAGEYFSNGLDDIHHLGNYTIDYGKETIMSMYAPAEVVDPAGRLYYVLPDGQRQLEYTFYYDYMGGPEYVWDRGGAYEIDVYGYLDGSNLLSFLTTMEFSVAINGGPTPTCVLSVTPDTIHPTQGETALLEWTSTNTTEVSFDNGIGSVATSGSLIVNPSDTTTYTAIFTGPEGSTTCIATVNTELSLHEKAAALAKQLVNRPDAYLWGGKGWDYDLGEFTSPDRILSGYTYFNPDTSSKDTGIGVDCSGLITWAYNRAHDAAAGFTKNYVQYVNADGMFRDHQSDPVAEADLHPGDTLSFDWNGDGRMDHVAMYVGDSGGYDVVNAANLDTGIEQQLSSFYSKISGFVDYRRLHQANAELAIKTGSPVDLVVTDPDGQILTATTDLSSEEEYIREIPGELYYLELEQGHDGRPQDLVIAPATIDGKYRIEVIPEPGADPAATYSLSVEVDGVETVVIDNETIDTIPETGFTLALNNGEVQDVDPTVKVLLNDLHQTLAGFNISSASRQKNLLSTIETAMSWFDKDRMDQVGRKLTKVQNDVNRHLADELTSAELDDVNGQINYLLSLVTI